MTGLPATLLATILGARHIGGPKERVATSVSTDTRKLTKGAVWFALKGANYDANNFAAAAALGGAAIAVVSAKPRGDTGDCVILEVPDTLEALQRLARWWRGRLGHLKVVGITGSNGKTSTKDFTRAVMSEGWQVTGTQGNLNNHIGVPLSVLAANPRDEVAVWEVGMNHPGELAPLCEMVQPRVGLISSIGSAHIEFFGSRLAIAKEKATLARYLPHDGMLLYPENCEFGNLLRSQTKAQVLTVGIGSGDIQACDIRSEGGGTRFVLKSLISGESAEVELAVAGQHMISNALLAAGAGMFYGLDIARIAQGLGKAKLSGGRLQALEWKGIEILDDSYNANPDSMAAALRTLAQAPGKGGRKVAVLGAMGELGDYALQGHREVGQLAASLGVDQVITQGEMGRDIHEAAHQAGGLAIHFDSIEEVVEYLGKTLNAGDMVLVKGSRSARMERVIEQAFPGIR